MEQKKDLAKIALAAMLLTAVAPVQALSNQDIVTQGTYLAAKCGAHGCNTIADNAGGSDVYNTRSNTYQVRSPASDASPQRYEENQGMSAVKQAALTEFELLDMLNPQARNIYLSLDPEGKALAIQLASQDSYRDKNLAIKEAQRRMNEKRGQANR